MDKIIPSNNESSDLENSTNRTNPVTDGDGSKIPDRIYLDFLENCNDYDAIWCDEPMNDTDIEYVRAPRWISVDDRLPDDERWLWVCINNREVKRGVFEGGKWKMIFDAPIQHILVTHWMYQQLPEPPEEE